MKRKKTKPLAKVKGMDMDRIMNTAQGINALLAMGKLLTRRKPKGKKNERYPADRLRKLRAERGVGSKARRLRARKTS